MVGYEIVRTSIAVMADDEDYARLPISRETDVALGLGFTGLYLSSAVYGLVSTSRCQRLKEGPTPELGEPVIGVTTSTEPAEPTEEPARGGAEPASPGPSTPTRSPAKAPAGSGGLRRRLTARLILDGGASLMVRRPDPKGAAWKRQLHHEETGSAPSRPQSVE